MGTKINNFGTINYNDHHKEITINGAGQNVTDIVRSFMADDVEPIEVDTPASDVFCRITKLAHEKGKAQIVDDELRSACVSAPKLVKTIRTNEALGYLDTQNLSSKDLYDLLDNHYGLDFGIRNFNAYRSK